MHRSLAAWFFLPILLSACNVLSPFTTRSSDTDYVEKGMQCLQDGDYACAVDNYNQISDSNLKTRKLCTAYLSQSGFSFSALLDTVVNKSSGAKMLGTLAQATLPWTAAKSSAADSAKTACIASATAANGDLGELLKGLGLLLHCANRIAKTDVYVASSDTDTTCTTSGNNDGKITQSDIGDDSGAITKKGMCPADVIACIEDIASLSPTGSGQSIKNSLDNIPSELKNSTTGTTVGRKGLRSLVASD